MKMAQSAETMRSNTLADQLAELASITKAQSEELRNFVSDATELPPSTSRAFLEILRQVELFGALLKAYVTPSMLKRLEQNLGEDIVDMSESITYCLELNRVWLLLLESIGRYYDRSALWRSLLDMFNDEIREVLELFRKQTRTWELNLFGTSRIEVTDGTTIESVTQTLAKMDEPSPVPLSLANERSNRRIPFIREANDLRLAAEIFREMPGAGLAGIKGVG
jgi:hypothetical protein